MARQLSAASRLADMDDVRRRASDVLDLLDRGEL